MLFSSFFTTISFKTERIEFRLGTHIISAWNSYNFGLELIVFGIGNNRGRNCDFINMLIC